MKIKKLIIPAVVLIIVALALTACGHKNGNNSKDNPSKEASGGASDENIKNITIGEYKLQYKGYEILKDDHGNNALALTCKFYNNSSEEASYFWTVYDTAMQNGNELNWAYVSVDADRNLISNGCNTVVQPDANAECIITYVLSDTTSPVTVTFTDKDGGYPQSLTIELK